MARPIYTEEKAVHLVRVFSATLAALMLIGWMDLVLIRPMKVDKLEMVSIHCSAIESVEVCWTHPLFLFCITGPHGS